MMNTRHHPFLRTAFLALLAVGAASSALAAPARMRKIYDPKAAPISAGHLMTAGGAGHLSDSQYQQIKYVTKELIKRFPPAQNFYLGIGRSPSAIISMFQNLTSDQVSPEEVAMNFPASGLHDGGHHDDASYFRHFDAIIPKSVTHGTRNIVLVDRSRPYQNNAASGGASLHMFKQILERYLRERGSSVKVEAAGFAYGPLNPAFGLHHIAFDMQTRPELERISMPYYEEVAEYPQHRITPNVQVPARRAQYKQYMSNMKERMIRDAELDAFLDKHAASELKAPSAEELAAAAAEEKAAQDKTAAQTKAVQDRAIAHARAFPAEAKKSLNALVAALPPRQEGHDKGPYLSPSATQLNEWLAKTLTQHGAAAALAPELAKAGSNDVVAMFMDHVEQARAENKIRNRDYRRLMGHALSAATMDEAMIAALSQRFSQSKHFQRELTEESDYYLNAHAEKNRPETAKMAANYQVLQKRIPQLAQAPSAAQ